MLLKAFYIAFIILGMYFMGILIQKLGKSSDESTNRPSYHIGCYQSDNPLNDSKAIQQYLFNLSTQLAPFSVREVRKYQKYADDLRVDPKGANAVALQFKTYITAFENIKSLNEYEQSYNKGMREARDDFLRCRDGFLEKQWDCKGAYGNFLNSENDFSLIKSNLSRLIQNKYEEQTKIQKLLNEDEGGTSDIDSKNYYNEIQFLNSQLSRLQQFVREKNQTLGGLDNKAFRLAHDLNNTKKQLQECRKNKKQLQVCKAINQKIKQIYFGITPLDFQTRINAKRMIIEKYHSALAKSNKVGQDTTEIKAQIARNNQQLKRLLQMYSQTENLDVCASDLIKKCSDQHITELQKNITDITQALKAIDLLQQQIRKGIANAQFLIDEINQKKQKVTDEFQNKIGSVQMLKEIQIKNQQKLITHRDNIYKINLQITGIQGNITQAQTKRKQAIGVLDGILSRVGELTECLSKKEYLIKLQSKRPKHSQEEANLKKIAADKLIKAIRLASK